MTIPPRLPLPLGLALAALLAAGPSPRAEEPAPSKLDGTWTWTWQDPQGQTHRHVLEVEGAGAKLAARERFDDLPPVRVADLKLDGKDVRFAVVRGAKRAEYRGVMDPNEPNTINGKVSIVEDGETNEYLWKAKREPAPGKEK